MPENEEVAFAQRERQCDILSDLVPRHRGTILQHYGEGSLRVFVRAVEAVECTVEIQEQLREELEVPMRIGVHTGDIVHDGIEIYGDGVNVAARLESLASPGCVLITGEMLDDVKNHPSLPTRACDRIKLENVKPPQRLFALAGEGLTVPTEAEVLDEQFEGASRPSPPGRARPSRTTPDRRRESARRS